MCGFKEDCFCFILTLVACTRFSLGLFQRALCPLGALMYPLGALMPFGGSNVPFGGSNEPFGSASKETICPLAPPQNQPIFNSHLNYLNLKTVWALSIELSEH